ncbi:MAG: hypothetical protein A3B68_09785 [Candidatus Melainabacteria bacterium RIFCSPHIGHO2_02_FULL_34_12]|nr:MAG: hypothetical protein A3B68_09785 [Candidatus Melainabacteria bacterium RIFCSPHIGHO2_02_FULL_34_12]
MSKKENNKAEVENQSAKTNSKRSYETDPTLKDIASNLNDKFSSLREGKESSPVDCINIFEKLHPPAGEISSFAKQIGELPELKVDFKNSLNKIASTFRNAFSNITEYNEINSQIKELLIENFFHTARALAIAVEARDPYTGGHSDRVFQIATELGKRCNISITEQLYLEGGALLHDVGKIAVRDGVLLKPGPLTDSEYKEMQLHTIFGSQIVKRMSCLHGCVDAVLLHHERMDGYGYPHGLKGKEIPLIARITSVADAYDAMTTNRIYRKALSHEQALEEILRNSGTQFDPEIVKVFLIWWEDTFQKNPAKSKELYKYSK